jgi:hypothetical protein
VPCNPPVVSWATANGNETLITSNANRKLMFFNRISAPPEFARGILGSPLQSLLLPERKRDLDFPSVKEE